MKEREIIKKLQLLQSVQPEKHMLHAIRKQVEFPNTGEDRLHLTKKFSIFTLIYPIVFASIIMVIITTSLFPDYLENTLTAARIALAVNHYDKAKIALEKIQERTAVLQHANNANTIVSFSYTLAVANTQISQLRLVGEKGKYTSYQCLELYESYHKDLEKIQSALHPEKNNNEVLLLTQAKLYDKYALAKLKKYHTGPKIDKEK